MTAVSGRVLVLNKNWVPVNVWPVLKAVHKVFKGRALFVDIETCATYDFESWVLSWDDAVRTAKIAANQAMQVGCGNWIVLPEVVVCTEYRGFGFKTNNRRPKFSRTNIYRRDRNTCQFCGTKLPTSELTLDHVIPKSKGGQMTWENIVLACPDCNNKKGNMTLKEAGMRLIRRPFTPKADDLRRSPVELLMYKVGNKPPKTWEQFLGKMYWNVELKD